MRTGEHENRQFVTTLYAASLREPAGIGPDGPLPTFSSPSRFAEGYRAEFGHPPSEKLRR